MAAGTGALEHRIVVAHVAFEGITRAYATSAFARIRQIRVRAWIFLARVGFSGTYLRGDADLLGGAAGLLPCHRAARANLARLGLDLPCITVALSNEPTAAIAIQELAAKLRSAGAAVAVLRKGLVCKARASARFTGSTIPVTVRAHQQLLATVTGIGTLELVRFARAIVGGSLVRAGVATARAAAGRHRPTSSVHSAGSASTTTASRACAGVRVAARIPRTSARLRDAPCAGRSTAVPGATRAAARAFCLTRTGAGRMAAVGSGNVAHAGGATRRRPIVEHTNIIGIFAAAAERAQPDTSA